MNLCVQCLRSAIAKGNPDGEIIEIVPAVECDYYFIDPDDHPAMKKCKECNADLPNPRFQLCSYCRERKANEAIEKDTRFL